ncbi:MAG: type II restriction endonuclease [Alistipes sp.]|nr:type II restriction endonuclease [Alistipes sp.]
MEQNNLVEQAIASVNKARTAFCKFTSANDAGYTGAHQAGYYMPRNAWKLMFDRPGSKGENLDRRVVIRWQHDFETGSRFIYYGRGTRNEYRLTRFGRNFPFLTENNVGDLLVLCHMDGDFYEGYVLSADEEIEAFLNAFGIGPTETNALIDKNRQPLPEEMIRDSFREVLERYAEDFPSTQLMAEFARSSCLEAHGVTDDMLRETPDKYLLFWINAEYELFRAFEHKIYTPAINAGFRDIEALISYSNQILNRRKSRAGKSLVHHLDAIFRTCGLRFDAQVLTEAYNRPDFIFPGKAAYRNPAFPAEDLVFLGAKTTCKDRWRQILGEAERIPRKHLFTLQPGLSKNQLTEMYKENICLVVPAAHISFFDRTFRDRILSLHDFISQVRQKQINLG